MSYNSEINFTRDEMEEKLRKCIDELLERDLCLLQNDVSERAITHKLAEYLQDEFPGLNVDCEYNRNAEFGPYISKILQIPKEDLTDFQDSEEEKLAISTFPDIIVHRRMINAKNLLVVEVKKTTSRVSHSHDYRKLKAFTDVGTNNPYHYRYGVFIVFEAGVKEPKPPRLVWFIEGNPGV